MPRSMTGFGRGEFSNEYYSLLVEIKTVNHKFLDISYRIPRNLQALEDRCRTFLQSLIFRGKIELFIQITEQKSVQKEIQLNQTVLDGYDNALEILRRRYNIDDKPSLELIATLPEVFQIIEKPLNIEEIWDCIKPALDMAVEQLINMRETEGGKLFEDIFHRLSKVEEFLAKIQLRAPSIIKDFQTRLQKNISELLPPEIVDEYQNRLLYEIVLYTDKTNITEEITRLRSHIFQFGEIAKQNEPIGRKLDFLLQEMNREVNTIGSKANDYELSRYVVEIKTELEKIREQIQNIE